MKMPDHCPKIRRGQIWRKRNGMHDISVIIRNKSKDDYWQTVNANNPKTHHHIKQKDLHLFYELVGNISRKQI